MKKILLTTCVFSVALLMAPSLNAQDMTQQERFHYWRDTAAMLQDQSSLIFEQAYKVLDLHGPSATPSVERKLALYAIDAQLHDTRLDSGQALYAFMNDVAHRLLAALKEPIAPGETRIHRFYNQGAIVQSAGATIAFDLVRGGTAERPFFSDSVMQAIIEHCDVMFVSHEHGDHADQRVARMFTQQGKNVVVPTGLWEDVSPLITPLRGERLHKTTIKLQHKGSELKVGVFPGHQDQVPNNVYIVTNPEGKTIVQTGDQANADDVEKIAAIGESFDVDILLAHCWMRPMERIVALIDPTLVVLGHENEMGHTIDHREPYWLTFRRIRHVEKPTVVMAWGEVLRLSAAEKN